MAYKHKVKKGDWCVPVTRYSSELKEELCPPKRHRRNRRVEDLRRRVKRALRRTERHSGRAECRAALGEHTVRARRLGEIIALGSSVRWEAFREAA